MCTNAGLVAPLSATIATIALPWRASLGTTRKKSGCAVASLSAGEVLANETIGIPAAERTALAPCDAPEQAAPATPTTPESTRLCADAPAVSPLQPVSPVTAAKCISFPIAAAAVFRSLIAVATAKLKPGAKSAIGPVESYRAPILMLTVVGAGAWNIGLSVPM